MIDHASRRSFLERAGLFSVAAIGLSPLAHAALAPIRRVGGAQLRVGLNAFSFLELLNENARDPGRGIDLFGVCDFCALQGFDAVDLTGYFFPGYPSAPDERYLSRLKRHALHLGLDISGTGVRNDFTAADRTVRDEGVRRIKIWIEVAAKIGAPVIRAFADSQPPFRNWREASRDASRDAVEAWMADCLRECAAHGEEFGVVVGVQNHGDFIADGRRAPAPDRARGARLLRRARRHGQIPVRRPLRRHRARGAVRGQLAGEGDPAAARSTLPGSTCARLVAIIRASSYRGYLPIETLAMGRKDYDPRVEVPKMLADLRAAIQAMAAGA